MELDATKLPVADARLGSGFPVDGIGKIATVKSPGKARSERAVGQVPARKGQARAQTVRTVADIHTHRFQCNWIKLPVVCSAAGSSLAHQVVKVLREADLPAISTKWLGTT